MQSYPVLTLRRAWRPFLRFRPVATKLLQLLGTDSVPLSRIADLISMDAAFCARILQRANSVEFGTVQEVTDVRHALSIIGLERTWQITTNAVMIAYIKAGPRTSGLRRCWQHSVATAVIAEEIARACNVFTAGVYTAGIMHDIGRLGLLVAYPAEYEQVIRDAAKRCIDLLDFERDHFGINHAEAGRWLADKWQLPEELRVVAGRHHDTFNGSDFTLVRLVHIACRLADFLGYDVTRPLGALDFNTIIAEIPDVARQQKKLTPEYLRLKVEAAISSHDGDTELAPPTETMAKAESVATEENFEFVLPVEDPPGNPPAAERNRILYLAVAAGILITGLLIMTRS